MRSKNFGRTVAVGIGLALAAMIPAASQARETGYKDQAASAYSAQALNALNARWNAEAASYKARLKALDASWNVATRRYGMH
jgi:hypothetical protein